MPRFNRRPPFKAILAAVIACLPLPTLAQSDVIDSSVHSFRVVTVAEGFVNPWSMAFLPGGDMLVTERGGQLRIVRNGRLLAEPVAGVPAVRVGGQGGLFDVVLHPDFESNRTVYLSYAKNNDDASLGTTALARATFENDRLNNVEEIFIAEAWAGTSGHYGARIAFGLDGYLYMSVGERMAPTQGDLSAHPAQVTTNHQGVIVRLNDDGSVPGTNPYVGRDGFLPEIWSYGHRNPQGLAVHPQTGDLWETEHGPQGGDEINLILPQLNYGWPVIGYGANYGSGTDIHTSRGAEGMQQPAAFWVPSIAASGLMVYSGDAFPQWQGNLFAGGLSGGHQRLSRVMLDGTTVSNREPLLLGRYRIRDVREGPDGFIYIATDNQYGAESSIVRLEPAD